MILFCSSAIIRPERANTSPILARICNAATKRGLAPPLLEFHITHSYPIIQLCGIFVSMATTNGTRARRTSSKLSLTSNSTDSRSTYTPSTQPTSGFREPSPAGHLQQLSPDVRSASASTHSTYISPSGRYSPVVNPAFTSWSPPPASDDVLLPPPRLGEAMSQSSSPTHSRPGSRAASPARPDNLLGPGTSSSGRLGKRKSWLPGVFSSKPSGKTDDPSSMQAWIIGEREGTPYDISTLLNAQKVSRLYPRHLSAGTQQVIGSRALG